MNLIDEELKPKNKDNSKKVARIILVIISLLIIAIIVSTPMIKKIIQRCCQNKKLNLVISILEPIILIALLLINTAYLIDSSYSPFLYFRF